MMPFKIKFSQLTAVYSYELSKSPWLLITGGKAPDSVWLKKMITLTKPAELWAADHGIDSYHNIQILPSCLLGDGDSASNTSWDWAKKNNVAIEKFPRAKDLTDTQLALEKMSTANAPFIIMTGAFGGRFDHAYSTIYSAAHSKTDCALIDDSEAVFFVKNGTDLKFNFTAVPKAISLLPITSEVTGVNVKNVRWELANATLKADFPNAVSNELLPDKNNFSIHIATGILAVYLYFGDN